MAQPHALIIDDNSNNAQVLAMLLESAGVQYTTLLSPKKLSETLDTMGQLDVIFLDLEMPNYNGFEVLRMFQAHPQQAHVPIVACTVHTSEVNQAKEAGFHSFIGKPLDVQRFPGQLQRILNNEAVWEY